MATLVSVNLPPVALRYLTNGLGWSADYVALYNEKGGSIDMQGWVTLTNQTGTTFHMADTVLVAGAPAMGGAELPGGGRGFGDRAIATDAALLGVHFAAGGADAHWAEHRIPGNMGV